MSIFKCESCGCAENTALCMYWNRGEGKALCSECDPKMGKWHRIFPKKQFDYYKITRLEVINVFDECKRAYVKRDCKIETSIQDNGRTLKIFVKEEEE